MGFRFLGDGASRRLVALVKSALAGKQDKLTGSAGQVVGFNDAGETETLALRAGDNVTIDQKDGVLTISATGGGGGGAEVPANIYGVEWDGTSNTRLSRTDAAALFIDPVPYVAGVSTGQCSSPFDGIMPWAGMGTVEDSQAGTLVKIPKYWYKWTKTGKRLKLQIANEKTDGFYVSPAHADRGDGKGERDFVYVGRYHCADNYKSQTGGKPKASITRSAARTGIHNLGSNIWQYDMAMRLTIQMLYLVEFADWNSQARIGYGCGNNTSTQNMGYTDSMPYHTGTTQTSRTTYGLGTQYRYIEGLWDNVYDRIDGCYNNSSGTSIIMNPSSFSDTANGTIIGNMSSAGDWVTAFDVVEAEGLQWIFPSITKGGSGSTYVPDGWFFVASYPCLSTGGGYNWELRHGMFFTGCGSASVVEDVVGCRLQKLPDPEETAA